MSPVLVRPIREQIEHDRVIRQLQARWRRKYEVGINVGKDEEVSVRGSGRLLFPDLVLTSTATGRRLHGLVEVETAESINRLEAMAEWTHFAKVRGAFYLYVPAGFTDVAERLCAAVGINVTEVWAYYAIGSQVKFSMTYRSPRARSAAKLAKTPKPAKKAAKKAAKRAAKKAAGTPKKGSKKKATKKAAKPTAKKTKAKLAKKATKRKLATNVRGGRKRAARKKK